MERTGSGLYMATRHVFGIEDFRRTALNFARSVRGAAGGTSTRPLSLRAVGSRNFVAPASKRFNCGNKGLMRKLTTLFLEQRDERLQVP